MGRSQTIGGRSRARGAPPTLSVTGWAREQNCLDFNSPWTAVVLSPVTALWSSIKAGPRIRGGAWGEGEEGMRSGYEDVQEGRNEIVV